MMYRATNVNIQEIDISHCGYVVGTLIDTEVTMVLDEYGELVEVELEGKREFGRQRMMFFINANSTATIEKEIWSAAKAHYAEHKWAIIERAEVPTTAFPYADEKLPQSAFI